MKQRSTNQNKHTMNRQTRDYKEEMPMFIAILLFALFLLAWSFIADRIREQNTTDIDPALWVEFQNCIDPYPSDAVCDSCYKAIIENKHHITPESHE